MNEELKTQITKNLIRKDGKLNTAIIRRENFLTSQLYNDILKTTDFLDKDQPPKVRIYCILNDITTTPKCVVCGNNAVFLPTHNAGYSKYCSSNCGKNSSDSHTKRNQTLIEKYGSKASPKARQKAKERSKDLQIKGRQTITQKYGVDNVSSLDFVKEKKRQTIQQRILTEYNGDQQSYYDDIIEKQQNTSTQKYNTEHFNRKHNIKAFNLLQDKEWVFQKYVIEKHTTTAIAIKLGLGPNCYSTVARYINMHNIETRRPGGFSYKAIQWLEWIMKVQNIYISHALNDGEYNIPQTPFHADGFCSYLNTAFEFYGDVFHGNLRTIPPNECCHPFRPNIQAKQLWLETKQREKIIRKTGVKVISIWESDFDQLIRKNIL